MTIGWMARVVRVVFRRLRRRQCRRCCELKVFLATNNTPGEATTQQTLSFAEEVSPRPPRCWSVQCPMVIIRQR